jgi:hypothetical protein
VAEPPFVRTTFSVSRATEYLEAKELEAQTGVPRAHFAHVAIRESIDNGLDAAETAGTAPRITLAVAWLCREVRIAVTDNGAGIAPETVRRILDFETRTSDKAAYVAPSRGQQGNALKTVMGLPCATGGAEPVIIEAAGIRHAVAASIDPARAVHVDYRQTRVPPRTGTSITLTLPARGQDVAPRAWARAFSLCNPHAFVHFAEWGTPDLPCSDEEPSVDEMYKPTVSFPGDGWSKYLPSDPTSAHWYDVAALERLVFSHIGEAERGGRDLTLREFVTQFRGLSRSDAAKGVTDQFPQIKRLSELGRRRRLVADLLAALRAAAPAPSAKLLGLVGEAHLQTRLREWYGIVPGRWWYRKHLGEADGMPFAVEVAVAETRAAVTERAGSGPWGLQTAINFSPTYGDPLFSTTLVAGEIGALGTENFLQEAHVLRGGYLDGDTYAPEHAAAFVHLVCPRLAFLDRGKTRLALPREMATAIAQTIWRACEVCYRDGERRRREAERARRLPAAPKQTGGLSVKAALLQVLPAAIQVATGGSVDVNTRKVFYAARPLVQKLTERPLEWSWFDTLFAQYRMEHPEECRLVFTEPRGYLLEPHTARVVQLGQRQVEGYEFPSWLYGSMLYIEKRGVIPTLQAARLPERFDLAIVAAQGYSTVAVRTLFARAERDRQYRLFVLHDADPDGYNIGRTLQEATRRMPTHEIEVVDLGLSLEEGLAMGLETETFTRSREMPSGLVLSDLEREYFTGNPKGGKWEARRIELDAMTGPQFVTYVVRKLVEQGVGKLAPPEQVLTERLAGGATQLVAGAVQARILREQDAVGQIAEALADFDALLEARRAELAALVAAAGREHPAQRWTVAIDAEARDLARKVLGSPGGGLAEGGATASSDPDPDVGPA